MVSDLEKINFESDLEELEKINFDTMKSDLDITRLGIFNYKINEENKKLFLEKTAEEVRPIMKFILDITIHVSYETFVKKIKENLIKLLKEHYKTNNTIFVFLNRFEYKSKSNYWMYKYILYFLKNIQEDVKIIFTLEEEEINDNDIILLIDDCIYSGEQMSSTIEKITDYYIGICIYL
jgi:chaperonin GroEL (HSP60 family)